MVKPEQAMALSAGAEIGTRVRDARARAGMVRRQLAAASGTSERYLAQIEAGSGNPTVSVLAALADALGVALAELLPLEGERSPLHAQAAAAMRRLSTERLHCLLDWIERLSGHGAKGRRILLVGLRGAGKSTLGSALAERLGVEFIELSKEVERLYGGDMGLLIELGGQGALRRYERQAWEQVVKTRESAVIAAPGGVVADAPLYERMLATSHSIWLEATPHDHMTRVMAQGDFRPMASNRSAMEDLRAILEARTPEYRRAGLRLNTSAQAFDRTFDLLLEMVWQTLGQ